MDPTPENMLPAFTKPPLAETVFGVQFSEIPTLRNAHLGAFWKSLGGDWPHVADAPPLPPQWERFNTQGAWRFPFMELLQPSARLQLRNKAQDRMIQLQNGRFHYNWIRRESAEYPRYAQLQIEFNEIFAQFRSFLENEGLPRLTFNQWEITYVNHLPAGPLWTRLADLRDVLSPLAGSVEKIGALRLESLEGAWHFEIEPQKGRLHIDWRHMQNTIVGQTGESPILILNLTARGPLSEDNIGGLGAGMDLGHSEVVQAFAAITSKSAHKHWERNA
jgi:uncharacterized protein (TIGR04255 family)